MAVDIGLALVGTGIGLGLRHGIDWDHIAAIGDVTASQQSRVRSIAMGTLYALGHAAVVIVLGLLAIWAGSTLPDSIDPIMERIVGVTLILLGLWIAISLVRNRGRLVFRSRWMLVADIVEAGFRKVRRRFGHHHAEPVAGKRNYGVASSATVGAVHGIGAETGSQAVLLASAAGATSATAGSFLLVSFVVGLIASNLLITLASTFGWAGSDSRRIVQSALGIMIASFSLVVGTLFLLHKGDLLPAFFG